MSQDTVSNLFDFPAREYNAIHGRWPSPDPAGAASAFTTDPQTWNRYAYARNNPLSLTDPTGMYLPCKGEDCISGADGGGGCMSDGAYYGCGSGDFGLFPGGGSVVACPNNQCQAFANGQYYQFEAFADGSSGYLSYQAPMGYSAQDIVNAQNIVSAAQGKAIDPRTLTGRALEVYNSLLRFVSPNITIYQTGTQSFEAVLTDAGFDQLQAADVNFGFFDATLHPEYTDGGRDDQMTDSLHFVWVDQSLTNAVGGDGVYMQFHIDSSNPEAGGFWGHAGCVVFHVGC